MKKGFTLIELLAVIVILAIIALIATPIVLDIIEDSKTNSNRRSIELYGNAVENSVAKEQLNGSVVPSGKYTTTDGKTLTNGNTTLKVDYDGAKTVCDVYVSSKGVVSLKRCKVNNQDIEYTYGDKIYDNGEVVYFDVTTGKTCDNYNEENSKTGYNGINGTENQNGCLKFYIFNDYGDSKVNLLLDHNTTSKTYWNNTNKDNNGIASNANGPQEVLDKLKEDTLSWQGTMSPTNYTMNQTGQISNAKYTIDYSEYKARLITAGEVAQITGNITFNERTSASHFYFDTNTRITSETCKSGNTSGCKYGWLYDRTNKNCKTYGCLNNSDVETQGYWTASSSASDTRDACDVYFYGFLYFNDSDNFDGFGVRPVIEILKSKL